MLNNQLKVESDKGFLDKLIDLRNLFYGKQIELAQKLGITQTHLGRMYKGGKASDTLKLLVNYVHKEFCYQKNPDEIKPTSNSQEAPQHGQPPDIRILRKRSKPEDS